MEMTFNFSELEIMLEAFEYISDISGLKPEELELYERVQEEMEKIYGRKSAL